MKLSAFLLFAVGFSFPLACSPGPQTDSKSNWYSLCSSNADCGESLSCACGVCTQNCDTAESCNGDSQCLNVGELTTCMEAQELVCVASCSHSDDCGPSQLCLSGACVAEDDVESEFCDDHEYAEATDRDFELLVIEKVNALREQGADCGGTTVGSGVASRLDFRLRCAARAQSDAMFEQDSLDGTTPDGVRFTERMTQAGYDSFGARVIISVQSDESHVDQILVDYCGGLLDPDLGDIGVGKVEDRLTILLATE